MKRGFRVSPQDLGSRTWSRRCVNVHTRHRMRDELRVDDVVCTCGWITAMDTCPMCGGARVYPAEVG